MLSVTETWTKNSGVYKNEKKEDVNLEKYIRIYEPMIELMEKGIHFEYKENGLEVWDTCHVPISFTKWADEYYDELQKEIAEGKLKLEDVDC